MKILCSLLVVIALLLFGCSKNNNSETIREAIVFQTLDSLFNPKAGVKVVLLEQFQTGPFTRKDSGISNLSGCVSFNGLLEGYNYKTSASLGCLTSDIGWHILLLEFHSYNLDTIPVYLRPSGYLKVTNTSSLLTRIWSTETAYENRIINGNSNNIFLHPAKLDTIFWAKWNPSINNYEPPIHDTIITLTCNDTTSLIVHL